MSFLHTTPALSSPSPSSASDAARPQGDRTHHHQDDDAASASTSTHSTRAPLPLPAPDEAAPTTLDVSGGGSSVKLDHLGPLVVHVDGTMSRIGNWAQLAPVEKETAMRILVSRNKQRLEALRRKKEEEVEKMEKQEEK
ncbi:hypothetical protein E4U41_000198 [Claviceps citrina]|nr:hypothetical protein E4U41_000198 [Claviceps citrina]